MLYRITGTKLIDNVTIVVEIVVEQSESVATAGLHKQLSGSYDRVIIESFYGNTGLKLQRKNLN